MAKRQQPKKKPAPVERVKPGKPDAEQAQEQQEEDEEAEADESEQQDNEGADQDDGAEDDNGEDADEAEDQAEDEDEEASDDDQGDAGTGEPDQEGGKDAPKAKAPASESAKAPVEQAGFAKRVGRESTAPKKPEKVRGPYLDSPRAFGIHIKGHLVRFGKGRTAINDHAYKQYGLTGADVLEALRKDSYVADNGAEVVA